MTVIYAVHPGTIIRKKSSHLCFCRVDPEGNEEVIAQKPVSQLEVIYVFGQVTVTTEAQKLCMSSGVDINYFNRSYKYIGTAMAVNFKGLDLKLLQYRNYADPELRVVTARNLVAGKISNQLSTLRYLNRNSGSLLQDQERYNMVTASLERTLAQVGKMTDYQKVLGAEGYASREYFSVLGSYFTGELKFSTRKHHPSPDPVNCLLSLGYTMLTNILTGFIISRGLEAGLGTLHAAQSGRESLALDLVEQFRAPVIDRLIIKNCNLRKFSPEMFCDDGVTGGVRFKKNMISSFFEIWDSNLHKEYTHNPLNTDEHPVRNLVELLLYQVDEYASALRSGRPYRSYVFDYR